MNVKTLRVSWEAAGAQLLLTVTQIKTPQPHRRPCWDTPGTQKRKKWTGLVCCRASNPSAGVLFLQQAADDDDDGDDGEGRGGFCLSDLHLSDELILHNPRSLQCHSGVWASLCLWVCLCTSRTDGVEKTDCLSNNEAAEHVLNCVWTH